jgi:hypothetical protein
MIEEVRTGRRIGTSVRPVEARDFRGLRVGWKFDWAIAATSMRVFKLVDPTDPDGILGLMALEQRENYVEVGLLECSAENVGQNKRFRGIAGSLFAFAAHLSFEIGAQGFITIEAKSELVDHFKQTYGFERVGNSQRMILGTLPASRLIATYGSST